MRQPDFSHQHIRKMLRRGIGPQRVSNHDPLVEKSTRQLLLESQGLRGNPADTIIQYVSYLRTIVLDTLLFVSATGRIIVQITYGEQIWDADGPELVALNIEALDIAAAAFSKVWMVDIFNFCTSSPLFPERHLHR
jgi:hypothetical protein